MEKLKEYRILKEIPGTSNMVDTFVKQEHFSVTKKKDGTVTSHVVLILFHIETNKMNDELKESSQYGVLNARPLVLLQNTVDALVKHGYLEEYVDKFLS